MKSTVMALMFLCAGVAFAAEPAHPNGAEGAKNAAAPAAKADKSKKTEKDAPKKKTGEAEKKEGKISLTKACERIPEVVKDPVLMGEIMKQLEASDQKQFLIEVNKAIVSMPGSNEQKTALFLTVEREAFLAAEPGNLQTLVASSFATVPVESQTVLADRYAEDLFNRSADAEKTFTDEQFTEIASSTVKEVAKECDGLSDSAPRVTLAIYLFEKASNDTIPELEDRLLETAFSDTQTRDVAKKEWLAEAKNTESSDRFSSLLGYADAGKSPNVDVVLNIAGPQVLTASLNDLAQCVTDGNGNQVMPVTQGENATGRETATANQTVQTGAGGTGTGMSTSDTRPMTSADVPWNPTKSREDVQDEKDHPGGYQYQY